MEGPLQIKTSFPLSVSSSKSMIWAVLDGCQLSYYRKFDFALQKPVDVRGVFVIKDNTKILKISEPKIEHGLSITTEKGSALFDCGDADTCSEWYKALNKAAKLLKDEEERHDKPARLRKILDIDPSGI